MNACLSESSKAVKSLKTKQPSHPWFGMTVRQSPVCASQTRICPARQQLASSMPSLAKHSISCRTGKEQETGSIRLKRSSFI